MGGGVIDLQRFLAELTGAVLRGRGFARHIVHAPGFGSEHRAMRTTLGGFSVGWQVRPGFAPAQPDEPRPLIILRRRTCPVSRSVRDVRSAPGSKTPRRGVAWQKARGVKMAALPTPAGVISSGRCFVIKRTNRPARDQTGVLVCREEAVIVLRASAARTAKAIASKWRSGVEGWATGRGDYRRQK